MNRPSIIALSALLVLSAPLAAHAQSADAAAQASDAAAEESETLAPSELNTALEGAADIDLSAVDADTRIEILPISARAEEGEKNTDEYTTAVTTDQEEVSTLLPALGENEFIMAALEEEGYTLDHVTSVQVHGDGSLTLYVDDEAATTEGSQPAGAPDADSEETTPADQQPNG
jgi:hypothetical protein